QYTSINQPHLVLFLFRIHAHHPHQHPFPTRRSSDLPKTIEIVWCQEEPENMGGWSFIEPRLRKLFERDIAYAGRDASASPAVGSLVRHKREQACVVADAFKV